MSSRARHTFRIRIVTLAAAFAAVVVIASVPRARADEPSCGLTDALENAMPGRSARTLSAALASVSERVHVDPARRTCVADPDDPFDPGAVMPAGEFVGECADTSDVRAPVVLSETADTLTIANFRHGGRWWIAEIPKDGIEHAYVQTAHFKGFPLGYLRAAHLQLMLKMRNDRTVRLRPQRRDETDCETRQLHDLIISSDVYRSRDHATGDTGTVMGDKAIATRFTSMTEQGFAEVAKGGSEHVDSDELRLDAAARTHLLEVAAHRAERESRGQQYGVARNNCASKLFETLDEAFPPRKSIAPVQIGVGSVLYGDLVAGPVQQGLSKRGLLLPGGHRVLDDDTRGGEELIGPRMHDVRRHDWGRQAAEAILGTDDELKRQRMIDNLLRPEGIGQTPADLVKRIMQSAPDETARERLRMLLPSAP